MSGKLILIDGHALAYRAYHALPLSLATSKGELTNAVYGFASMLLNVWQEEKPDYIIATFDAGPSFRHGEYEAYKAHRVRMPSEMGVQLARIQELVEAFHIPALSLEGYEADDLLGTLARQAEEKGLETIILTGDTDAFQLISPRTRVLTSRRRFSDTFIYDEKAIRERYGLEPSQIIDLKALVGDVSDNIPGVRGIGEKTATELLQKCRSLEGIYEHLNEISPRHRKALEEERDKAFLSKRLATIRTDVPITLDLEASRVSRYDRERVKALFRELEFRSLMERLPEIAPPTPQVEEGPPPQPSPSRGKVKGGGTEGGEEGLPAYQIITSEEALDELINCLRRAGKFSIDTETTATDAMKAELVGLAFAWQEGVAAYIPLGHLPSHPPAEQIPMLPEIEVPRTSEVRGTSVGQLPLDYTLEKLRPILEDESLEKYAHNGKYDLTVLARCGVRVQNLTFDTMIAEWLINPESRNLGLKNLAFTRLNVEMTPIAALIGTGKKQISMAEVPVEKAAPYAGADADMAYCLVGNLEAELKEKALWPLFTEVEMPLVPILVDMEMAGVLLDRKVLDEMATELGRRLAELEERIYKEVGIPFNINSTQQLSDALFVHLGLPARGLKKTKSGHYSTDATILEKLRGEHPVIEIILEHRQLSKLKSTYVDALPKLINPHTGRLHTSYNQTGTVTGRLSSSEPNLQNIPIRTEEGRQVRRAFAAGEGCLLLSADYSQVELRILAHISQDPAMLEAFGRGEDIHASTASAIYNVPLDAVTPEMRRIAKTTNFAISYGVTGFGLSQQTDLTPEEGEAFIKAYFARYPKVKEYIERTKSQAAKQGYVETLLKRRRYFPRLASSEKVHPTVRQADERAAINFPIQGTAADIIKIAMIRLYRKLKERALKTCMILQVHDELVLEAPEEELEEVAPLVKEIMEGAFKLDAPLKVDLKVGKNWLEMEELGG